MATFLRVCDVRLPVALGTPKEKAEEVGNTGRAHSGKLRRSRLARKRGLSFETPPLKPSEARAWEALLAGEGERWSFDSDLYGSRGTGPSSSSGASADATRSKFGAKSLKLVATTGTVTYALAGANSVVGATYLFWHWNGSSWDSWAYVYNAGSFEKFKNYVATGTSPSGLTVTPSLTQLVLAAGGADVWVDDLVALAASVPSTWITAESFPSTSTAFSNLPELRVSADAVPEASNRTMLGTVEEVQFEKGARDGTKYTNLHRLSVALEEA